MRKKSTKKTSTKKSLDFGNFQITGNSVDPDVLFVVDPLIGNPKKERTNALNRQQMEYIGRQFKGSSVKFDNAAFLTAAPPAEKLVFDKDRAIGDHLKVNREEFANICNSLKPKLIVAMGKLGARQVQGRAVQITKIRGLPNMNEEWDCIVLPSLGLNHVMRYPENAEIFRSDMETVKSIVKSGFSLDYTKKIKTDYKWVTDIDFLLKRKDIEFASIDIEGVGLDPYDPATKILTVQICVEEGKAYAIDVRNKKHPRVKKVIRQLKKFLGREDIHCIGHNLKFDFQMLREKLGVTIRNYGWDTMVMAHIVDENMLTFNLADCVRRWVPALSGYSDKFDRDPIHVGKTRMDLVPAKDMLEYGCGDVDAALRLFYVLKDIIEEDAQLPNYYDKVIRPGLRAFCDIERYGFAIDKSKLKDFEKYLRKEQKREHKRIMKMIPKSLIEKHSQKGVDKFNITRPVFLVDMCFTHKDGLCLEPKVFTPSTRNEPDPRKRVPSTSTKDHFPYFEGNPFIDAISAYVKNEKLLSTYVGSEDNPDGSITGFYKYIKNNAIRPTYSFVGTNTGRLSSRDPNGQNFPKRGEAAKRYRKMFVAPPGWILVDADLSQIELRAAAYLANETTMLRYFQQGIDLHAATAAKVMGKSLKQFLAMDKDTIGLKRFQAKAVNFGFLYGMWWVKFMSYAKTQYGIDYTEKEAEAIRKAFFELYPELITWHHECGQIVQRDGQIRSPLGRIRHLPSVYSNDESVAKQAMRQGINAPVQSFGSDLGVMAIGRLAKAGIDPDKFRIIGFIHDDIICMAREEYVGVAARTLKRYMETNPLKEWFGIDLPVKIIAEAAVGYNLSDTVEVNSYIQDKNVRTIDDLRRKVRDALDATPDTPSNKKKREALEKELAALCPDGNIPEARPKSRVIKLNKVKVASKTSSTKRKIRIKSSSSTEQKHGKSTETKKSQRRKVKALRRTRKASGHNTEIQGTQRGRNFGNQRLKSAENASQERPVRVPRSIERKSKQRRSA